MYLVYLSMDMAHNERILAVQSRISRETQESHSISPNSQVPPVSFIKGYSIFEVLHFYEDERN